MSSLIVIAWPARARRAPRIPYHRHSTFSKTTRVLNLHSPKPQTPPARPPTPQTLRTLDVRGNALGDGGAILLSRGLREHANERLAELDLGYNEIKDDGACQLALALKANPGGAPRELKVNANYITRFGQVALTEAIDHVYDCGKREMTITF